MNERSGLITLAAYLSAALVIVVAACVGLLRYGALARVSALGVGPVEPTQELAEAGLHRLSEEAPLGGVARTLDRQRARLLETMLAEKTQLLQEQARQLARQQQELADLRRRYDEVVQDALDGVLAVLPSDASADGSSATPAEGPPPSHGDPRRLEAELVLGSTLHETLQNDLELLQAELDRAQEQITRLREEANRQSMQQLRDALALEAAAAGVLQRLGKSAVPALSEALRHSDPVVRRWAANALGSFGADAAEVTDALAEALSDADPNVRRAVASALDAIER